MSQANVAALEPRIRERRLCTLPLSDAGNAERLLTEHGADLRFVPGVGWHTWDGQRWQRDGDGEVTRRMLATIRALRRLAADLPSEEAQALFNHALRSEQSSRIQGAIDIASKANKSGIAAASELDVDAFRMTVANGTNDLRTGDLRPHDRGDLITKLAPVEYDPEARDPRWDRFLAEVTAGDVALASFLQRIAGYCLTGDISEEVLFLVHGPAATGKSTFLEALKATLGDYATAANFETFIARRESGGPRTDIARLAGARLVIGAEVDDGKRLAEGLVKQITGGDTVTARHLYRDEFEYRPAFKLVLAANHAPQVSHADDAIWRRILRVPFEQHIPVERRDRTLKAHLREPSAAVLAWAVQGCLQWQREGLAVPDTVEAATAAYRDEMDRLADFLDECCALDPGHQVASRRLWSAYLEWAKSNGEREPLSRRAFAEALKMRHCVTRRTNSERLWIGITLRKVTQ